MVALLVASLLTLLACNPGFEDPSLVKDLRVLGIRADPPEYVVEDVPVEGLPVRLTVLLADPERRALWCELRTCSLEDTYTCEGAADTVSLGAGKCGDGEWVHDVLLDSALVHAAQAKDPTYGTPVYSGVAIWVELVVTGGEMPLFALKSVLVSPPNPAGRIPNNNPKVETVKVNGTAIQGGTFSYTGGDPVEVEVVPAEGSKEKRLLPTFFPPGGSEEVEEFLTAFFYADGGTFSDSSRSDKPSNIFEGKPQGEGARLKTRWIPPESPREVRFWFVLVDDVGGVDWVVSMGIPSSR